MSLTALLSALVLTSAASDLTRPQDQAVRVPDIAVTGRTLKERTRDFVGRVAAPPRGRGLARWDGGGRNGLTA